jgi:hypothetical protein
MTDTSRTLIIESSPAKLFGLVGLGLLMTVCAIFVAFVPGVDLFGKIVGGYFGIVFFGLCTCVAVSRLLKSPRTVITISPEGICDRRVAAALIPWSAVTRISTWSYRGRNRCVVLALKPGVEARLGLTRVARWTRGANRALGADGLCIMPAGLKVDYDTLLKLCQDYAQQAHGDDLAHRPVVPDRQRDYA